MPSERINANEDIIVEVEQMIDSLEEIRAYLINLKG
jgi:succinate dehydrogenase/fumarate reductase-like Fe-S protein